MVEISKQQVDQVTKATQNVFAHLHPFAHHTEHYFDHLEKSTDGLQHELGGLLNQGGLESVRKALAASKEVTSGKIELKVGLDDDRLSSIELYNKKNGDQLFITEGGGLETVRHRKLPDYDQLNFWPKK